MTLETVWVSFADKKRFRGVAIVDVDLDEKDKKPEVALKVAAKTIEMECNAGPDTEVKMLRLRSHIECDYKNKLIFDEVLLENIGEELAQKQRPH